MTPPAIRQYAAWLGAMVLMALWSGCSPSSSSPASPGGTTNSAAAPRAIAPDAPVLDPALLPKVSATNGYAGSASCRECHADPYDSWHRSFHRTMTQLADARTVQAKFDRVVLTNNGTRFNLSTRSNELWVRMEKIAVSNSDAVQPGAVDAPISLVTGSHHMQIFWLPNGMGNCQIGFPFTWLIPEQRWVPRNSTFLRPPDADHKSETWNIVCSRCHTTGPEPHLNRQERTFATQVAEFGISCEACHGPAARHVAVETDRRTRGLPRKESGVDHAIVHPEKLEPARTSQVCAFCHSMKWYDRNEGWAENGFRFRPGDDLEATTPVIRPRLLDQQPWLNRVLAANPDLLKDFFWNDGMIRVSGREYNGLIESPCYKGGKFTCLSCHSLHSSEPDDQLARDRTDNRACIQCHPKFRDSSALVAHTHHGPTSSGSECYNCHMPHTTYGVLSAIRSHEISSPRVADALKTGRPDACTLCHLDQTLQWTASRLSEWYRQPVPALPEGAGQLAESVRLALTGDAGQRALITWHLGWEPALRASGVPRGSGWTEPLLGLLLDDPYAAIRCLAERSLRQSGSAAPAGYDYTMPPESRSPARLQVWERWATALGKGAVDPGRARRVLAESPRDLGSALAPWLARRNERPLRLRE